MCQVPGGFIADRFGAKRTMLAALALWSAFTGLTGFAVSFGMLLFVRVLTDLIAPVRITHLAVAGQHPGDGCGSLGYPVVASAVLAGQAATIGTTTRSWTSRSPGPASWSASTASMDRRQTGSLLGVACRLNGGFCAHQPGPAIHDGLADRPGLTKVRFGPDRPVRDR